MYDEGSVFSIMLSIVTYKKNKLSYEVQQVWQVS
jgi:hypothetical protein